jgi:hypothetical protein
MADDRGVRRTRVTLVRVRQTAPRRCATEAMAAAWRCEGNRLVLSLDDALPLTVVLRHLIESAQRDKPPPHPERTPSAELFAEGVRLGGSRGLCRGRAPSVKRTEVPLREQRAVV